MRLLIMKIIAMSYDVDKPENREFGNIKQLDGKWQVRMKDLSGLIYWLLLNDSEVVWIMETDEEFIKSFRDKFNEALDNALSIYIKNFM